MSARRELIEYHVDAHEPVLVWLREVLTDGHGDWVNMEPIVDDQDATRLAVRSGIMGWLSGRSSDLPFVTVVGATLGRRPTPGSLGIQHGAGPKASRILAAGGVPEPSGWRRRQDHSKRGLVYEQDGGSDVDVLWDFIVAATDCLCPTELDGRWSGVRHTAR